MQKFHSAAVVPYRLLSRTVTTCCLALVLLSPTFGEKNPRPQSLRKQFKREWKAAGLPMETAREILAARRAFKRGENDDLVGLALGEDQAVAVPACVFLADALGSQKALEFARSRRFKPARSPRI